MRDQLREPREKEVGQVLTEVWRHKCREALARRKKCDHSAYTVGRGGVCDCFVEEALLRAAAEGQPLYRSQRDEVARLLGGAR
jgi:hypothetical protein